MTTVTIFGAGIAGLTAAHEFAMRGYAVTVYEANDDAGGFFRSARIPHDGVPVGMPSEYSWHGVGPWYHNSFDVMRQIPMGDGTVYDQLSRPLDFGIAAEDGKAKFTSPAMFRFTWVDTVRWAWLMLKTWSADERTTKHYSSINASEAFRPILSDRGWKTWRSCFGPWVGSDWTRVSLHNVGQFFRRNMFSGRTWTHVDDAGEWTHGPRDGWLVFRRPSSEAWFDPWVAHLRESGVQFHFGTKLHSLTMDGGPERRVLSATLGGALEPVTSDIYVLATTPFAALDVIDRSGLDAREGELFSRALCQDGPHTQVSFRIAFEECVKWPGERTALVCADTPWNLTLFAQEQAWEDDVDLGIRVKSLWTGTACVSSAPGLNGRTIEQCTKEQFVQEIESQLRGSRGFSDTINGANGGRLWSQFSMANIEVWHEWVFREGGGLDPRHPKWVTSSTTQPHVPPQRTAISNLVLAGAHTHTDADVWSIEAAVESGRRAVQVFEPAVEVLRQHKPLVLRWLSEIDNLCYRAGAPHFLDLVRGMVVLVLILCVCVLI